MRTMQRLAMKGHWHKRRVGRLRSLRAVLRYAALLQFLSSTPLQAQSGNPRSDSLQRPKNRGEGSANKPGPRVDSQSHVVKPPTDSQDARLAFGFGLGIPEFFPFEALYFVNQHVAVRGFYVFPIPFNVRVEMPADVVSKKGIRVEHPDLNVKFKALYGPQYGIEALIFPFGGNFHLFAGASYRKLGLKGGVSSKLFLRPLEGGEALVTNSSVSLQADAATAQYVARAGLGYVMYSPLGIYINAFLGFSKPYKAHSNINVEANILNESATNPEDVTAALSELKDVKERDMEEKALKAMEPAEKLSLPIIGLTVGYFFSP